MKEEYTVVWSEQGKGQREPFRSYPEAEGRARAISEKVGGAVTIETRVRLLMARFEAGRQTLPHAMTEYPGTHV